jgi:hypothetical protein
MHVSGRASQPEFFAGETHLRILAACSEHLAAIDWHHQVIAVIVQEQIEKVTAVTPQTLPERLARLLRYVDTKRLFVRLRSSLKLNGNDWEIAVAMKRSGDRPAELGGTLIIWTRWRPSQLATARRRPERSAAFGTIVHPVLRPH